MFVRKKKYIQALKDNQSLSDELNKTSHILLEAQKKNSELVDDRDAWRTKYELAVHTPEYKLDAEAAFTRGYTDARQKMAAWLIETGSKMRAEMGSNE